MTMFWVVAALFIAGALLMLLPALLAPRAAGASSAGANLAVHRDQLREAEADVAAGLIDPARLAEARAEIERRVLEDVDTAADRASRVARAADAPARRTAFAVALLVPLASIVAYLALGNPQAAAPPEMPSERHALTPQQIQQMVAALAERLRANPNDAQGWLMLGRSYTALGRYKDGVMALKRGAELLPPNPALLADLADVAAMAQGKRFAGEPTRYVQMALDLDPKHAKALALAGTIAFEAHDYASARGYWERLLAVLPADSPAQRSIRGSIVEASQLEAKADAAAAARVAAAPADQRAGTGSALRGEVQVSAELAARIAPGDTLFVFARAAEGPRMPLAILRRPAGAGTQAFQLDDSMAMTPGRTLSGAGAVVVGARISKTGNASGASGDLVGETGPVAPDASGIRLVIDRVQP